MISELKVKSARDLGENEKLLQQISLHDHRVQLLEQTKQRLEGETVRLESELHSAHTFISKLQGEKAQVQDEFAQLTKKHKALQAAMTQDALMDDTDVENTRKEFELILNRSQQISQEMLKLKDERSLLIS